MPAEHVLDLTRIDRLGFDEAIYCAGKTAGQIGAILADAAGRDDYLLLTRLDEVKATEVASGLEGTFDYDPISRTAFFGGRRIAEPSVTVGVVTAGTSDVPVAREVSRTLAYYGHRPTEVVDVGVAGLWRLLDRVEELSRLPVVVVCAGMDAALPSVLGGLIPGAIIAVPTSQGYGIASGGETALRSALCACSPGVTVVNIDNGYGAACAAMRVVNAAVLARGDA